jgi:hypothetical protein
MPYFAAEPAPYFPRPLRQLGVNNAPDNAGLRRHAVPLQRFSLFALPSQP